MRIAFFLHIIVVFFVMQAAVYAKGFAPWVGEDYTGNPCNGGAMDYGPFDYNNKKHKIEKLPIVEKHHFMLSVEKLVNSENYRSATHVLGNVGYTIRAFPNHHRALATLIRYYVRELKKNNFKNTATDIARKIRGTPPECYLQRAINFSPNDGNVFALTGYYTHQINRLEDAESAYRSAIKLSPKNSEIHYNYGLLLIQNQRYEEARVQAKIAYKLGYPLPGLKRRLQKAGYDFQ